MGAFMAKNLIKKGYKLTVYDINKKAIDNVVSAGAKGAESIAEVSKNSEVLVTMLPMNQHVLDCYTSETGIIRLLVDYFKVCASSIFCNIRVIIS
jgi:2-hydroxy-3-oxopropionate reductase